MSPGPTLLRFANDADYQFFVNLDAIGSVNAVDLLPFRLHLADAPTGQMSDVVVIGDEEFALVEPVSGSLFDVRAHGLKPMLAIPCKSNMQVFLFDWSSSQMSTKDRWEFESLEHELTCAAQ